MPRDPHPHLETPALENLNLRVSAGENLHVPIAKIAGLGQYMGKATPAVKELTPADLNDLATRFQGGKVNNAKVNKLTFRDVESLEQVFAAQKLGAVSALKPGAAMDVSCCSCTPCCCCT